MKIEPKCLKFNTKENKGAAYTSDGFMLPCCWIDDPPVYRYVKECGLKDPELALSNNERLEDIFTSNQWENFFQTLINNPENASYMCKKKCGVDIPMEVIREEEKIEVKGVANGSYY
jgi:hypothetical protein